jgi:hypothetical protein
MGDKFVFWLAGKHWCMTDQQATHGSFFHLSGLHVRSSSAVFSFQAGLIP